MPFSALRAVVQKYHLDEFEQIVCDFESALECAINEKKIKEERTYLFILVLIAGNVIVTVREVIGLCALGYADGALSIARSLYEQFIIVSFFEMHKQDNNFNEYVDNYYKDYDRVCTRYLDLQARNWGFEAHAPQNSKTRKKTNQSCLKEKKDYWWTLKNSFMDVVKEVSCDYIKNGKGKTYSKMLAMYKRACATIHPSCFSCIWRLEAGLQYQGINTAPSERGHELPLELTVLCISVIFCSILNRLEFDSTSIEMRVKKLIELYDQYEHENQQSF